MWSEEFSENSECSVASQYIQIIIPRSVVWFAFGRPRRSGGFFVNIEIFSQRFNFCALSANVVKGLNSFENYEEKYIHFYFKRFFLKRFSSAINKAQPIG